MSEANVELAYQGFDALNRRDLPAYLALMDDAWRPSRAWPRSRAATSPVRDHGDLTVISRPRRHRRRWGHLVEFLPDIVLD